MKIRIESYLAARELVEIRLSWGGTEKKLVLTHEECFQLIDALHSYELLWQGPRPVKDP